VASAHGSNWSACDNGMVRKLFFQGRWHGLIETFFKTKVASANGNQFPEICHPCLAVASAHGNNWSMSDNGIVQKLFCQGRWHRPIETFFKTKVASFEKYVSQIMLPCSSNRKFPKMSKNIYNALRLCGITFS